MPPGPYHACTINLRVRVVIEHVGIDLDLTYPFQRETCTKHKLIRLKYIYIILRGKFVPREL